MTELVAGRELDALVAERVMGYWQVEIYEGELVHGESNMNGWPMPTPFYSTDIALAWQVVSEVQRRFPGCRFSILGGDEQWGYTDTGTKDLDNLPVYAVDKTRRYVFGWHARFFGGQDPTVATPMSWGDEYADTPAHAICLAALKACEELRGGEADTPPTPECVDCHRPATAGKWCEYCFRIAKL